MSQVNDSRKIPHQANVPTPAPAQQLNPAPTQTPGPVLCRDCRHWNRTWPQANHAQCLMATRFSTGGNILLTTDLQTCSKGEPRI